MFRYYLHYIGHKEFLPSLPQRDVTIHFALTRGYTLEQILQSRIFILRLKGD